MSPPVMCIPGRKAELGANSHTTLRSRQGALMPLGMYIEEVS